MYGVSLSPAPFTVRAAKTPIVRPAASQAAGARLMELRWEQAKAAFAQGAITRTQLIALLAAHWSIRSPEIVQMILSNPREAQDLLVSGGFSAQASEVRALVQAYSKL